MCELRITAFGWCQVLLGVRVIRRARRGRLHPAASHFDLPEAYIPKYLAEKIISSKAALEGERKHVTVLFADVKSSMELLADRDPEEARKIIDPVLAHMMESVHHYEGTVNQVMGDGIMALFGAPLAHEDHAVRACYAALRMQDLIRQYTEETRRNYGIEVQIRIGIHSGEVVVRSIGSDLRMDYSAVGQTTHLAARMEQLAPPGVTRADRRDGAAGRWVRPGEAARRDPDQGDCGAARGVRAVGCRHGAHAAAGCAGAGLHALRGPRRRAGAGEPGSRARPPWSRPDRCGRGRAGRRQIPAAARVHPLSSQSWLARARSELGFLRQGDALSSSHGSPARVSPCRGSRRRSQCASQNHRHAAGARPRAGRGCACDHMAPGRARA